MSFLKNPHNLTIFITPTTIEEVNDLLSDLKASKRIGPSSLPTKIMKQSNDIITSPLAESINKSFQSGIFPDNFKNTKVIPIFKVSHKYSAITIDQYRCSQTLAN